MTNRSREWIIRLLLATVVPVVLLFAAEVLLRSGGFGYSPDFWVPVEGRRLLTTNDNFGRRFFPRSLARIPVPEVVDAKKAPNTRRVFVLGESAAMGFPEPAFGFARMLQVILERRYPDLRWEVINAAMTAINSHAILPIARDCARLQPDAFVVVMGNNEAVGPYGPGTVFSRVDLSLPLIRLSVWQSATRIGQAANSWIRDNAQRPSEWRGMEMFLEKRLSASDPRLERMYEHYETNLQEITELGVQAGATVVLATVPVNLRDSPPFASLEPTEATGARVRQWAAELAQGKDAESRGAASEAVSHYRNAVTAAPDHAESQFRLARCLSSLGDESGAANYYHRARDLDALRFRADTRINTIVRKVAQASWSGKVALADAEKAFGLGGEDLFYEHVHLTPAGNYRLATLLADAFGKPELREQTTPAFPDVARSLALTRWDETLMRAQIGALLERPPFTAQVDHRRRLVRFQTTIEHGSALLAEARPWYENALRNRPGDTHLIARYAELLRASGESKAAAAEFTKLIHLVPGRKTWYASRAAALSDAGLQEEAVADFRRALALDAQFDVAHFGLGLVRARQARHHEAADHYREALRINPFYVEASYNLAGVLARLGQNAESRAALEEVVKIKPSFAEARVALGQLLARSGDTKAAIDQYRAAVQSRPDLPEARYDLGVLLVTTGQIDESIKQYEEAIRLRPAYAEAHNNLGTALARKGQLQSAAQAFERALELKPSFQAAQLNLDRARKADVSRR